MPDKWTTRNSTSSLVMPVVGGNSIQGICHTCQPLKNKRYLLHFYNKSSQHPEQGTLGRKERALVEAKAATVNNFSGGNPLVLCCLSVCIWMWFCGCSFVRQEFWVPTLVPPAVVSECGCVFESLLECVYPCAWVCVSVCGFTVPFLVVSVFICVYVLFFADLSGGVCVCTLLCLEYNKAFICVLLPRWPALLRVSVSEPTRSCLSRDGAWCWWDGADESCCSSHW